MTTPPTKPPRGIKHPKETSGLLMSVIRTLSASESNEQRDREKAKLEREYKKSDQRLDELVSHHDQDLTQVMQLFAKLSARVTLSREKIHAVKENLQACKMLLHCRRDELKKLWLEGVEHKHVLQLLEEIDQLREVPAKLTQFLNKKHYLHATQLLVSALTLGEGGLEGVEALREVKADLQAKKQQLHLKLMDELSAHIYKQTSAEVLALRRQGSGRDPMGLHSPFQRAGELRSSARNPRVRRALLDLASPHSGSQSPRGLTPNAGQALEESYEVIEDVDAADPEADSEHFLSILVECLALLGKLPDAVETLKVEMQAELLSIIGRTTKHLQGVGDTGGEASTTTTIASAAVPAQAQPPQPLLLLLQTVFEQFRRVAAAHAAVLKMLARTSDKYRVDVRLYEMADVWSKVQAVLQLLLTDYLDIQNTASAAPQAPPAFSEPTSDISIYFGRRKQTRSKRMPLFKFDYSSHALTINSYLKDGISVKDHQGNSKALVREKHLVCPPDPRNITFIFIPLMQFIEEIEQNLGCSPGSPCTLNAFLADYVKEVFLGRHHHLVQRAIEAATKAPDAWRATITPEHMQRLGVSRPLLQNTVTVEKYIRDLHNLMQALPAYAEHFLTSICNILRSYRETCQAAYRGIVQPDSEDKRICSAAWLKDEDISRFIKSLPNWADLQKQKAMHARLSKRDALRREALRREETTEEESPEEIRQRNLREAEILASNLGEGGVSAHEILSDTSQLRGLAQLQESMEWFACSVQLFASQLPRGDASANGGISALPETSLHTLDQLALEFEELANTCLLVLHLEVRVQCFHYLLPRPTALGRFATNGVDAQEPDPKVLELSRVLVSIDEAMNSSLHIRKSKYIFEGLGHLIAKILITSAQYMERIDEAGIQKMCRNIFALQQTLTNITMSREIALDHARSYFELFYMTPEEILSSVTEKGPQFSELEYMNAFQLIHRSALQDVDYGAINTHLSRLSDILGEVGVTV